jgi:hypothetical protein
MTEVADSFVRNGPVSPDQFVGRATQVDSCVSRIAKGESSAIIGDPHIGKSSFLRYVLHKHETLLPEHGGSLQDYVFAYKDLSLVNNETPHSEFWHLILRRIVGDELTSSLQLRLARFVTKNDFSPDSLYDLFDTLGTNHQHVVFLLDEFDYLLGLPKFKDSGFFPTLRALVCTRGLTVVFTSRKPISHLNRVAAEYNPHGSPFFNVYEETTLGSLTPAECRQLLKVGTIFSEEEYSYLTALAGRHPNLLQMAASYWCDSKANGLNSDQAREQVRARLYKQASILFDGNWPTIDPRGRVALVLFALDFFGGQLGKKSFSLADAAELLHDWYSDQLHELAERGILSSSGTSLDCAVMAQWLVREKIAPARSSKLTYEQWLEGNEFQLGGLLTTIEINFLKKVWEAVPKDLLYKIGPLLTGGAM